MKGKEEEAGSVHQDLKLASRIAQGDQKAFAEFVDLYGPRIQAMARRFAPTPADADDLTQEIFLNLYRSIGLFRGESALATWVYRVALNHGLKYRRHEPPASTPYEEALAQSPAHDWDGPAQRAQVSELRQKVDDALLGLTPEHRAVVVLHELQELTYSECAAILRVPVGTVKSRLHHAFGNLRGSLAGYVLGDDLPARAQENEPVRKGAATENLS